MTSQLQAWACDAGTLIHAIKTNENVRLMQGVVDIVLRGAIENEICARVKDRAVRWSYHELTTKYAAFVERNGVYPVGDTSLSDDWEAACDDMVADVFEPYANVLTISFGEYLIDTRLHLGEEHISRIANKFSETVWATLSWYAPYDKNEVGRKMTPAELLREFGIDYFELRDEIAVMKGEGATSLPPKQEIEAVSIADVIDKIRTAEFTEADLMEALETVNDTDDGLALSAAKTTWGGDMPDVVALRAFMRDFGGDGPSSVFAMVTGAPDEVVSMAVDISNPSNSDDWALALFGAPAGSPPAIVITGQTGVVAEDAGTIGEDWMAGLTGGPAVPEFPVETADAPKTPRPRGGKNADPATTPGAMQTETLVAIKNACGVNDQEMADIVGTSRATWNNYLKGKGAFVPDDVQKARIKDFLKAKRDALDEVWRAI